MSEKRSKDTPGNTISAQAAFDREMVRVAAGLYRVDSVLARLYEEDLQVTRFGIVCPNMERSDYMGVVSAVHGGVEVVAFHGGDSFHSTVVGLLARLENGSLKWRPDRKR